MSHHPHKHHHTTPKVLFILKRRDSGSYGEWNYSENGDRSSGLSNSVIFMTGMLKRLNIDAKMVTVADNNQIDREVTLYRPTHVIIEAFWVVAEKFDVLKRLHPHVQWLVRNHSKTEFLSAEGQAFGRALGYMQRGVQVASNSLEAYYDMTVLARSLGLPNENASYLPNYYPVAPDRGNYPLPNRRKHETTVNVGCFGAIRPLKNTMVQAVAAVNFADKHGLHLRFHINGTRIEGRGESITSNLRAMFDGLKHDLVEHEWMKHDDFLVVLKSMDMLLQVSFSETFNIVAADAVGQHVPIIVSDEIPWAHKQSIANPNESLSITKLMGVIHSEGPFHMRRRLATQKHYLQTYNIRTEKAWLKRLGVKTEDC